MEGDFNTDGKQDYLLNLYKIKDIDNPKYKKSIEVRAVIIYSKKSLYKHHSKGLPLSRGTVHDVDSFRPKARSHFALVKPGTFKARDYKKGEFKEVVIKYPSIAVMNGSNLRVFSWTGDSFSEIMIYDSMR